MAQNIPSRTKWTPPPARIEGDRLLKAKAAEVRVRNAAVQTKAQEERTKEILGQELGTKVDKLEETVDRLIDNIPKILPNGGGAGKRTIAKILERDFDFPDSLDRKNETVPTRTVLKALKTSRHTVAYLTEAGREGQFIFRAGDYSAEIAADTLEGIYIKANDTDASVGAWVRVHDFTDILVTWFGAKGDGVTDDYAAIMAAMDWNLSPWGSTIRLPFGATGSYRTSDTIIVLPGKNLVSTSGSEGNDGTAFRGGVEILADLAVSPILKLDGGSGSTSVNAEKLFVRRAAGAIPANSVGVLVVNANNVLLSDIISRRSAKGFKIGDGIGVSLAVTLFQCNTAEISDVHLEVEDTVEVTVISTRFGRNGGGDLAANAYIRLVGFVDTVSFIRSQGNQSSTNVSVGLDVLNYDNPNGIIVFDACHFEAIAGPFVNESGTWVTPISRLVLQGTTAHCFNVDTELLSVSPENVLQLVISGCPSLGYRLTLDQQTYWKVNSNYFIYGVLLNQGTGIFYGNECAAGLTVQGACNGVQVYGNTVIGGSFSNTATGEVWVWGNAANTNALSDAIINSIPGETLRLGSTGVDFGVKRFTATMDGSGEALISHGMSGTAIIQGLLSISAVRKGASGEAAPCTVSFVDGTYIAVTGGTAGAACRVTLIYSKTLDAW